VKLTGIGNQIGLYKEFGPFVHFFNLQQKTSLVELHWNTITKRLSHLDPQQAKISPFWNYFHFSSRVQASSLKKEQFSQLTKNKNFHFTARVCLHFWTYKKWIRKVTKHMPFWRLSKEKQWLLGKDIFKKGLKWTNFSVRILVNGASLSLHHKLFSWKSIYIT